MGEPEVNPNPSPFRRDPNIPHLFAGPDQYWADLRARDPEHAHSVACQLESLLYTGVGDNKNAKVPMSPTTSEESFADPVVVTTSTSASRTRTWQSVISSDVLHATKGIIRTCPNLPAHQSVLVEAEGAPELHLMVEEAPSVFPEMKAAFQNSQ